MIIFILNGYFLDNAGFSKRCQKEVEILSQHDQVLIISRDSKKSVTTYKHPHVRVQSFTVDAELVETPHTYKSGFYEFYRNMKLFIPLFTTVFAAVKRYHKETLTVYVISSPMTVPLFCLVIIRLFGLSRTVLEFHDLEPEMAITIKNLKRTSFILRIEYLLETFLCKRYSRIIVTSETQKNTLQKRTRIDPVKIFTLFNTIDYAAYHRIPVTDTLHQLSFANDDFVVGYISSMTFAYTITGICELLAEMSGVLHSYATIKFIIVGDGDMLYRVRETITHFELEDYVVLTGKIQEVESVLQRMDVGIIPLLEDAHTRTVLPTRLFEYFAAKKSVIAPDFDSFKEIIVDQENGLLYTSLSDLKEKIIYLKEHIKERKILAEHGYKEFLKRYELHHYYQPYLTFLNI